MGRKSGRLIEYKGRQLALLHCLTVFIVIRRRENDRARHVVVLLVGRAVDFPPVWPSSTHLRQHQKRQRYVEVGLFDMVVIEVRLKPVRWFKRMQTVAAKSALCAVLARSTAAVLLTRSLLTVVCTQFVWRFELSVLMKQNVLRMHLKNYTDD